MWTTPKEPDRWKGESCIGAGSEVLSRYCDVSLEVLLNGSWRQALNTL